MPLGERRPAEYADVEPPAKRPPPYEGRAAVVEDVLPRAPPLDPEPPREPEDPEEPELPLDEEEPMVKCVSLYSEKISAASNKER